MKNQTNKPTSDEVLINKWVRHIMAKIDRQDTFPLMDSEYRKILRDMLAEAKVEIERAQWKENAIRREAEGYRQDYMKLIHWLCDNGLGSSCNNAADEVTQLLDLKQKKIDVLEEYVKLLNAELCEAVSCAANHGWRSQRVDAGIQIRERIRTIDTQIEDIKICR